MKVLILDSRVIYDLALNRNQTRERIKQILGSLSDDFELRVSSLVRSQLQELIGNIEAEKYISAFSDFFFEINPDLLRIIKEIEIEDFHSSIEAAYAKTRRDAFIVTTCPESFKSSGVNIFGASHLKSLKEKLELEKIYLLKFVEPIEEVQHLVGVGVPTTKEEGDKHENSIDFQYVKIISTNIPLLTFEQEIDLFIDWATRKQSKYVCVANTDMLLESYRRPNFSQVLQKADVVVPEGIPILWMMKLLGRKRQDRITRLDLLTTLCQQASEQNVKVFFLGSHQNILDRMRYRLIKDFPSLQISEMKPLPFRQLTPKEDEALIKEINESGAGLIFLSMGCPRQERWMADHQGKIQAVMIGFGAVFYSYAGMKKWTPRWIRQAGLEWIYFLMQQPKRLIGRYAKTIPPFIFLSIIQLLSHHFSFIKVQKR